MGKTFSTGLLTNGIWQDASNNIGIGAANSSFKFQVTGTTNLTGALSGTSATFNANTSGGFLGLTLANAGTGAAQILLNNSAQRWIINLRTDNLFSIYNDTTATTPFLINTTGIATFSSTSSGGQNLVMKTSIAAGRNYMQFANGTGDMGYMGYGGADSKFYIVNQLNDDMLFYTNSAERMRINALGYLKASPNGSYQGATAQYHEIRQTTTSDSLIIFNHTGTSPIGTETSFTGADPNNTTNYVYAAYTTSPSFVWIYRIWSNGTVSTRSDARWKKNIETTRNGYLEDLCKLRVVKYNWYNNEDDAPKELGLIAQEVEEVFPNLISYDKVTTKKQIEQEDGSFVEQEVEDGESRSVKTSVLPYMLLKGLQEAMVKIEKLEAEIEELRQIVATK